jgi:hypothetical protein
MPLIDLKTNLKDLKFGHDEYKGGSSQQPFIQTAVPATDQPLQTGTSVSGDNILQGAGFIALGAGAGAAIGAIAGSGFGFGSTGFTVATLVGTAVGTGIGIAGATSVAGSSVTGIKLPRAGTGGPDFLVRGGTLVSNIIADDVERLTKFFKTTEGALFVTKQNLLSRVAVRTQTSGLLNEGIYNPLGTLTQAAGSAYGLHVNKQGLNPFASTGPTSDNDNLYFVRIANYTNESLNSPDGILKNRLVALQQSKIAGTYASLGIGFGKVNDISSEPGFLISYQGGPGSNAIGIGNTNIKIATNNLGATVKTSDAVSETALTQQQLSTAGNLNEVLRKVPSSPPKITDFRAFLRSGIASSTVLSAAPSYEGNKTIEPRTNSGDPGNTAEKDVFDYTTGYLNDVNKSFGAASPNSYDKINALPLYQSEGINGDYPIDDLISFRIGVVNNDNPRLKTYIHFRAFLDSISDQYKVEWKGTKYLGRGEDFYTYSGFDRQVSLSWTVVAQSKAELIPMYKKLNYLASICMPDYGSNGYMRGNLVTLTVGGYFNEQYGIITGFSYEMNDADATWEIGINNTGNSDSSVEQLPHLIKITGFNFIPIHNFVPRKQQNEFAGSLEGNGPITTYGKEHYISLSGAVSSNPLYNSTPEQVDTPFYNQQGLVLPNLAPILQFTTTPLGEEDLTPPGIIN